MEAFWILDFEGLGIEGLLLIWLVVDLGPFLFHVKLHLSIRHSRVLHFELIDLLSHKLAVGALRLLLMLRGLLQRHVNFLSFVRLMLNELCPCGSGLVF